MMQATVIRAVTTKTTPFFTLRTICTTPTVVHQTTKLTTFCPVHNGFYTLFYQTSHLYSINILAHQASFLPANASLSDPRQRHSSHISAHLIRFTSDQRHNFYVGIGILPTRPPKTKIPTLSPVRPDFSSQHSSSSSPTPSPLFS